MSEDKTKKPKKAQIDVWRSIQSLRRLMTVSQEFRNKEAGSTGKEIIDEIGGHLKRLRKEMRLEPTARTFVERTKASVEMRTSIALANLMSERSRTKYDLSVGGKESGTASWSRFNKRHEFVLGYRWVDKVCPLAKNLLNGKSIIPLSVVEYRVNVRDVRIFACNVWDFTKKEELKGYIGLSMYSGKCVFKLTVTEAIKAAQASTVKSINNKIGIENG